MTEAGSPSPDPSKIRTIPEPPYVRLPDPLALFAGRAARFRHLAEGHDLAPYLQFLAGLADVQSAVQGDLPAPRMPDRAVLERAARHGMPPLDRAGFAPDPVVHALVDRLVALAEGLDVPPAAAAALGRVAAAAEGERATMIGNVLADAIPFEAVAEHVLVAAALQVHFARAAAGLDPRSLKPVGDGVCPACGGAPTAGLVVGWPRAEGTRYCACSLCATMWNYVRAKCTLCGSTKAISLREIEGSGGNVKAEVCGSCHGYLKVLYQQHDPRLEPVADDVATLGLDMLVREQGFRRGGVNPFLVGY